MLCFDLFSVELAVLQCWFWVLFFTDPPDAAIYQFPGFHFFFNYIWTDFAEKPAEWILKMCLLKKNREDYTLIGSLKHNQFSQNT